MASFSSDEARQQSITRRMLRDAIINADLLDNLSVHKRHLWPDAVDRTRLGSGAVENRHLSGEVRGLIQAGYHLRVGIPAQTWDGYLTLDSSAVRSSGWGDNDPLGGDATRFTAPRTGYTTFALDAVPMGDPPGSGVEATITVEVNGEERWARTGKVNDNGIPSLYVEVGDLVAGDHLKLHSDTALEVEAGGEAITQLVDRASSEAAEPEVKPTEAVDSTVDGNNDTSATVDTANLAGVEVGDVMVFTMAAGYISGTLASIDLPGGVDEVPGAESHWGSSNDSWMKVGWRRATASDVAGENTYTGSFVTNGDGTSRRAALHLVVYRQADFPSGSGFWGSVVEDTISGDFTSITLTAPSEVGFALCVAMRWNSGGSAGTGNVEFSEPTVEMSQGFPSGGRNPQMVEGIAEAGADVTAEFLEDGRNNHLVVVGVG